LLTANPVKANTLFLEVTRPDEDTVLKTAAVKNRCGFESHGFRLMNGPWERWVDGWVVESVGDVFVEDDQLPDSHKAIKKHRKSTGDSAPRLHA